MWFCLAKWILLVRLISLGQIARSTYDLLNQKEKLKKPTYQAAKKASLCEKFKKPTSGSEKGPSQSPLLPFDLSQLFRILLKIWFLDYPPLISPPSSIAQIAGELPAEAEAV